LAKWNFFEGKEDIRHEHGHAKGGRICVDNVTLGKLRSIGKEMLASVGR